MKKWCREKQEKVVINLNNAALTFTETSHKKRHLFFKNCDYFYEYSTKEIRKTSIKNMNNILRKPLKTLFC